MRRNAIRLTFVLLAAAVWAGCGAGGERDAVKTYAEETLPPLIDILTAALERYDNVCLLYTSDAADE